MKYGDPNLQQYEESKLEQKQSESKKFTLTTTFARKKKKKKKNLFKDKKIVEGQSNFTTTVIEPRRS